MKRILIISLLISSGLLAGDKVAITMKATGQVSKISAGEKQGQPLKRGVGLINEDLIRTGKDGFAATMYLDDKTTIKVRENTEFLIGGVRTAAGINKRVSMSYGKMLASVSKQKGSEFIIATPTSVASVKGTDVIIISDPVLGDLFITIIGVITVTNNATGETTTVEEGETANSTPDGTLDVNETDVADIPDFDEGVDGEGVEQHEIRFEIENEDGTIHEIIIQYQ